MHDPSTGDANTGAPNTGAPNAGDGDHPEAEDSFTFREDEDADMLGAAATIAVGPETKRAGKGPRGPRGPRTRRSLLRSLLVVAVPVVLLAFVPLLWSSLEKTPRDKVGISYGGGPIEGSHFQRIVQPGSSLFFNGFFDVLYLYPADQQNYIISKVTTEGEAGVDFVAAPSKDRVQVQYQIATYFKLNTDRLRQFHEELGLKFRAYTTPGWNDLIHNTFRQQIEAALQQETRRYEVAELFGDAERLVELQRAVQSSVTEKLRTALGEDFFCAATFKPGGECAPVTLIVKKIDIPDNVAKAFEDVRVSEAQIQTKLNEIQQREAEAKAIDALNDALAEHGDLYVLIKAIEKGSINFWVLPTDSGLTLQTPGLTGNATSDGATGDGAGG
jgi:regulator of protease activity HflC (stomatin/prohibitin superfamily)